MPVDAKTFGLPLPTQLSDGLAIMHINPGLDAIPCQGPIHGSRVDIGEAQSLGDKLCVGAFATGTGAINGNHYGFARFHPNFSGKQ